MTRAGERVPHGLRGTLRLLDLGAEGESWGWGRCGCPARAIT